MKSDLPTDYDSICRSHKYKNKSKFTCIPIGLTQGQFNLSAFKIAEQYKWFQMRSACLMAFCHLFIQDPLKWTSQTINTILINGAKVVKDNYVRVKENGPLDCVLNIENYIVKMRIEEPIFLNTIESNTSLAEILDSFFQDHEHGLFRCLNLCYLIWKANGIYFLFDGQGNGSAADDKNGCASLVCTESLKDVSKLLKTISAMKLDDCYAISHITMKHFREGVSNYTKPRIQYAGANTYTIVSDCFAILSGKFHIGHNGFQLIRNRQSMAVNLMSLIYHVIQPANSWNSQLIDKIVLLGTKLFHECKKTPQGEITIQHLPRKYRVLQYIFNIEYKPYDHNGQMSYSLDEIKKNLLMYLQQAIVGGAQRSVFIQINSIVFAVWESNNYYYIFDAYARNQLGEVTDDQLGTPCIQMHGSLESLCNVLATNLNSITSSNDDFVLHGVNVTLETTNSGKNISDSDLESVNTLMDDQFWAEMNNFQESSARSEEICNLDDSSDDDIFMETVGGLHRAVSSIDSTESRSTTSFVSESEGSVRTESSSKESASNTQSNDESEPSKSNKARSKSPKNQEKITEKVVEELNENVEEVEAKQDDNKRKQDDNKRKQDDKKRKQGDKKRKQDDKKRKQDDKQGKDDKDGKQDNKEYKQADKEGKQDDKEGKQDNKEGKQTDNKFNKEKKTKRKLKDNVDGEDGKDDGQNVKNREEKNRKKKSQDTQNENVGKQETKKSLVVVESSSGTEASITKLLTTSFKISDRVLLVTEWGDFFLAQDNNGYFLLDGCLCDYNALIQINLNDLDSSKKLDDIDRIVNKIMDLKSTRNVTIQSESDKKNLSEASDIGEENSALSGDMDAPLWELIEGVIELMNTTAKFDKIKSELV